jgi:molybdopterin-guanine dinucleotide biosynthesis protein A/ADP-ribose pyrophosphatase YjhB (NUDIX family)
MSENRGRFAAVVLAGGRGERAGDPKGLIDVGGEPWLERQLQLLAQITSHPSVVVAGVHFEAYAACFGDDARCCIVRNQNPDLGPFSSLQLALAKVLERNPDVAGVFVLPVDTPAPVLRVWQALAARVEEGALAALPSRTEAGVGAGDGKNYLVRPARSGHPVCLSAALCRHVLSMDVNRPDARLNLLLASLAPHEKAYVEVDDARVFLNLNHRWEWDLVAPIAMPNALSVLPAVERRRASVVCQSNEGVLAVAAREPLSRHLFHFPPGGGIEPGEEPAAAAVREVWEETGFRVAVDAASEVLAYHLFPWRGVLYSSTTHFFSGTLCADGHRPFSPDDPVLEGRHWIPIGRLDEVFGFLPGTLKAVRELLRCRSER